MMKSSNKYVGINSQFCFVGEVPDKEHTVCMQRSSSPKDSSRVRSLSPLAAHRESQEVQEEEVAKIREMIDKETPPLAASTPISVANDSPRRESPRNEEVVIERNRSFREDAEVHDRLFQSSPDSGMLLYTRNIFKLGNFHLKYT